MVEAAAEVPIRLHRAQPRDDDGVPPRRLRVALVNPRFDPSYFGMDYALPLLPGDKRNGVVTNALPTLAGLAPPFCDMLLVDENVEAIDFALLATYDVVGVTGMMVQRRRIFEILDRLRGSGPVVIAGGPFVSVAPEEFTARCDACFVGEAETTWPRFLEDVARGRPLQSRYEQAERTDMATVPPPRYDLLRNAHYLTASLQFSRGCPFLCEFCDIITVFGRTPRTKTTQQMLAEFDAILRAGYRSCFLVDDNFIGNRKRAKELLRALVEWQQRHGYPLSLVTEASINLADDDELLQLMAAANVRHVFIGIESPDPAALNETRKVQNVRGDPLEVRIARIRDAGIVIQAGFIVGFDSDTPAVFDLQYDFIQRSGIANAIVAILSPIPGTPLYARLLREGRLDFADPEIVFRPQGMDRATLRSGYERLLRRLYEPDAYFERLFRGYAGSSSFRRVQADLDARQASLRRGPRVLQALGAAVAVAGQALRLARELRRHGQLVRFLRVYRKIWRDLNRPLGDEALPLGVFLRVCISHWHYHRISLGAETRFGSATAAPAQPVAQHPH